MILEGKPLIGWAIFQALAVKQIDRIIVSTDSLEIAKVAKLYGAEVPFLRPAELSTDKSSEWMAWRHALEYILKTEGRLPLTMVSIPATAPLRLPSDISECLSEFKKGGADLVITATESHRNPYFNMIKIEENGFATLVMPPVHSLSRRQDAPEVFDMTTVCYVADPNFVMQHNSHFAGKVRVVLIPRERSIDIDTPLDFRIAEILMRERHENSEI